MLCALLHVRPRRQSSNVIGMVQAGARAEGRPVTCPSRATLGTRRSSGCCTSPRSAEPARGGTSRPGVSERAGGRGVGRAGGVPPRPPGAFRRRRTPSLRTRQAHRFGQRVCIRHLLRPPPGRCGAAGCRPAGRRRSARPRTGCPRGSWRGWCHRRPRSGTSSGSDGGPRGCPGTASPRRGSRRSGGSVREPPTDTGVAYGAGQNKHGALNQALPQVRNGWSRSTTAVSASRVSMDRHGASVQIVAR